MKKMFTKIEAGSLLRKAVQTGKRKKKPCKVCKSVKSEAHHSDYSKPLSVIWFCRKHHAEWHSKNGFPKAKIIVETLSGHLKDKRDFLISLLKKQGFSEEDIRQIFKL